MTPPLSWRTLETTVGLDALPAFHRAFLTWRGVEGAADMPLRRVQQRVEAELNRLVQAGQATRDGEDWQLAPGTLDTFEAYGALGAAGAGHAGATLDG
ncbi:hypothetical protein HNQ07_002987 [Deinococcus metalli]|uniref:Uncharacterized protein n=1 Tax=Deinococcus metalli TaxID=1141878 RepID=A0A7W8NR34_9DEIO|nr:hypothetical protein [Deinococcus metalli]MBB5377495.1 hypothetical protein [Deinococcus metalli]GHF50866.1 hypothetical protein GCM10017781_29240 [Deinococcus metalli]